MLDELIFDPAPHVEALINRAVRRLGIYENDPVKLAAFAQRVRGLLMEFSQDDGQDPFILGFSLGRVDSMVADRYRWQNEDFAEALFTAIRDHLADAIQEAKRDLK